MENFYDLKIDGETITVKIENGKTAELFLDDEKVTIDFDGNVGGNASLVQNVSRLDNAPSITKSSATDKAEIDGILRTCCRLGNRRWCISGGCANTPCGWICG
jgi:hypothetical protein